jgi:uncharacterized membrane protein
MAARWTRGTWAGWSLMTFMAISIGAYGIAFVFAGGIEQVLPQMAYHLPDRAMFAATHFGVGALVLSIGPFQFLPALRAKLPAVHRWVGRVYVAGCILSGLAGLVLATYTNAGPIARTGFSLLAAFWLTTTSIAFLKARGRDFKAHRQWMIRSYALTLAAVTLRIYLPVSMIGFGKGFLDVYPAISFACWVPNAIVAEWFIRRR